MERSGSVDCKASVRAGVAALAISADTSNVSPPEAVKVFRVFPIISTLMPVELPLLVVGTTAVDGVCADESVVSDSVGENQDLLAERRGRQGDVAARYRSGPQ